MFLLSPLWLLVPLLPFAVVQLLATRVLGNDILDFPVYRNVAVGIGVGTLAATGWLLFRDNANALTLVIVPVVVSVVVEAFLWVLFAVLYVARRIARILQIALQPPDPENNN